jgi:hypothetical protein
MGLADCETGYSNAQPARQANKAGKLRRRTRLLSLSAVVVFFLTV